MNTDIVEQLLALNRQFYQTFALQFSATRLRLQPGVKRLLADFPIDACILDLGCGNGELALALEHSHFGGQYVGCDVSPGLLSVAKSHVSEGSILPSQKYQFYLADLASPDWQTVIPNLPYNRALSFAVLHHFPGNDLRLQFLSHLHTLLVRHNDPQSFFIHSVWQFLNSPRLRLRIQPWSRIGLSDEEVDPGDFLLDWRSGGQGLRYVHHFSEAELQELAKAAGFSIRQTFYSDGEGGNLGLYQVWEAMRV